MKKCKYEGCNKLVSDSDRDGYCRYHKQRIKMDKIKEEWKRKGLCLHCGKKPKVKTICPHCNKIVEYYASCENCYQSNKRYEKKSSLKKGNESLNNKESNN